MSPQRKQAAPSGQRKPASKSRQAASVLKRSNKSTMLMGQAPKMTDAELARVAFGPALKRELDRMIDESYEK